MFCWEKRWKPPVWGELESSFALQASTHQSSFSSVFFIFWQFGNKNWKSFFTLVSASSFSRKQRCQSELLPVSASPVLRLHHPHGYDFYQRLSCSWSYPVLRVWKDFHQAHPVKSDTSCLNSSLGACQCGEGSCVFKSNSLYFWSFWCSVRFSS